MKILQTFFLSAATTVFLAACNPPAPPVVEPTAFDLGITVTGVPNAPVKVLNAAGEIKFDATVTGSKTLSALPKGKYTVTGGAVANFTAPAAQTADLSVGNGAVTLGYVALPGSALAATTVSGVIPDWKLGAASASLAHVSVDSAQAVRISGSVLPKGSVAADGTLSIALLPTSTPERLFQLLPPESYGGCAYVGEASNRALQVDQFPNKLIEIGGAPIGSVQEYVTDSPADNRHIVVRFYSDADGVFKGRLTCQNVSPAPPTVTVLDLTLSKGWNIAEVYGDPDDADHYATLPAGTRISLRYRPFTPALQLTLNNPSVQLRRGERVTTAAAITQIGGYSGTVSLSTNVPGVTVEPATLTLAPITTQGLTTQAMNDPRLMRRQEIAQSVSAANVSTSLTFVASADAAEHGYASGDQLLLKDAAGTMLGSVSLSVTVSVPSVTGSLNGVSLDRGQTITTDAYLYSNNGYTGPVTVSMENLPEGVSAPSVSATLSNGYISVPLSLTASATAEPSTKTAQLVVNAGGAVTKRDVQVTVAKPTVQVLLGTSTVDVRRGQTAKLSVQVSSQHTFSGTTTVSLTGLPAGVSAPALTLQVTPGATTSAILDISASDTATLGTLEASVVGNDIEISLYNTAPKLTVNVQTGVTAALSEPVSIARAATGVWTLSSSGQYTGGTYVSTLNRYEGKQKVFTKTVSVPGYSSQLVSSPSGDAVVISGNVTRVQADGTTNTFNTYISSSSAQMAVDAQNQLWWVTYDPLTSDYWLAKLDLSTGAQMKVLNVNNSSINISRNNDGTMFYLTGVTSGAITQFNPLTGSKIKDISTPGVGYAVAVAVAQDGTVWGAQSSYSGGIFRVNADGTLTIFTALSSISRLAFDALDPNVLWGGSNYGASVFKIDVLAGTSATIPTGFVSGIAADSAGGLWVAVGSGYTNTNVLSFVK